MLMILRPYLAQYDLKGFENTFPSDLPSNIVGIIYLHHRSAPGTVLGTGVMEVSKAWSLSSELVVESCV